MAVFASKFGLGDHVYIAYEPEDISGVECRDYKGRPIPRTSYFKVYEDTVIEAQFRCWGCCDVWYRLRNTEYPRRFYRVYATPEEAVEGCRNEEIELAEYHLAQAKKSKNSRKDSGKWFITKIEDLKNHTGSYMLYSLKKSSNGKIYRKGVYVEVKHS